MERGQSGLEYIAIVGTVLVLLFFSFYYIFYNSSGNLVTISGTNIVASGQSLHQDVLEALQKAATDFGKNVKVTSGVRTVEKQAELFYKNCIKNGPKSCNHGTCNPVPLNKRNGFLKRDNNKKWILEGSLSGKYNDEDEVIKKLIGLGNPESCPHTKSYAVDIWCAGGSNWKYDPQCQAELTKVMVDNGFCRIKIEAWHFEFVEMSSSHKNGGCVTDKSPKYFYKGKWYDPTESNCNLYNYDTHKCVS